MKYLLTGATGFIGSALRPRLLREGHELVVITRMPERYKDQTATNQRFISWDDDLAESMAQVDVVINLAGENLFDRRWTRKVKKTLYDSRIRTTGKLVDAISAVSESERPDLLVSVSGVNYYGDRGSEKITESDPPTDDFLGALCQEWEAEANRARSEGVRVVTPRLGPVLQKDGGMLEQMRRPFLFFAGGPIGSGRQYIPWIHMNDLCRALLYPVENEEFSGPYNVCVPAACTMNEFARTMGEVMNRPSFFRVPEWLLRIVVGEASADITSSLNVYPERLLSFGFEFEFEDLEEALADLL